MRRRIHISPDQDSLPFKSHERRGILAYALPWERRLVVLMGAAFLLCVSLYIYFVMASVVHVAARQEILSQVTKTKTAVSELETQYLAKTEGVTEAYAHSIGYVTASNQVFVQKMSAVSLHDAH